jgi:hypothetical protein
MPVGELLRRTSSAELSEWAAFEREHGPIGEERADLRAALVCRTIAAAAGASGVTLDDYLLKFGIDAEPVRQSDQQMIEFAREYTKKFNEHQKQIGAA